MQPWWGVVLGVPLLIGAAVGRRCLAAGQDRSERLRILAVAATALAVGSSVLGALAGGRLGAAAFDPVDVPYGALAAALLAATLLGGGAATQLWPPGRSQALPDTDPEPDAGDPGLNDAAPPELHSSAAPEGADSSAVELGNGGVEGD